MRFGEKYLKSILDFDGQREQLKIHNEVKNPTHLRLEERILTPVFMKCVKSKSINFWRQKTQRLKIC